MTDRTGGNGAAAASSQDREDDNWEVDERKGKIANGAGDHDEDRDDDHDLEDVDDAGEGEDEISVRDLAIELGWDPGGKGGKFKPGDAGYVGPEEYLRRVSRSQKGLSKKLADSEAEFDRRLQRLEQSSSVARRREIDQIMAAVDELVDEAIESGDRTKIRAALRRRDEAIGELEDEANQPKEMTDEQFVEFMAENTPHLSVQRPFFQDHSWLLDEDDEDGCEAFGDVEELIQDEVNAFARKKGHDPRKHGAYQPTKAEFAEAFEKAERLLRRVYPHKFERRNEEDDDMDDERGGRGRERNRDGGGRFTRDRDGDGGERRERRMPVLASGNRSRGKSLASRLPPEALKAADQFIEQKLFADREEYARVYLKEKGEKVD